MRQGTTPTHIFTFPFDLSIVKDLSIVHQTGEFKYAYKEG